MSISGPWAFTLMVLSILGAIHGIFLLDASVGPIEPPDRATKPAPGELYGEYHSSIGVPVDARVNATTLQQLQSYSGAWEAYHQRLSYQILRGHYRQLERQRRQQENRQAENTSEDEEVPDVDEVYGHLENAESIAEHSFQQSTSPEALLIGAATEGTTLGALETLYTGTETAYTIYEINQEVDAAREKSFANIDAIIKDYTQDGASEAAVNPGYLEAGKALAYYRYVQLYGTPDSQLKASRFQSRLTNGPIVYRVSQQKAYNDVSLIVVEWRAGGNITCFSTPGCTYEGEVAYNDGGAILYVGSEVTGPDSDVDLSRFRHRVYYTKNVAAWRSAMRANSAGSNDLARFLAGGAYSTESFDGGDRIVVRSRNFTNGPPDIPPTASLSQTNLSRAEHDQLVKMQQTAQQYTGYVNASYDRLASVYHRHYYGREPQLSGYPSGFGDASHEWAHFAAIVNRTATMYHPDAYNASTGTYVDTNARITAIETLLDEFESAEAYDRYLGDKQQGLESDIRRVERSPSSAKWGPIGDAGLAIRRTINFYDMNIWGKLWFGVNALAGILLILTLIATIQWAWRRV